MTRNPWVLPEALERDYLSLTQLIADTSERDVIPCLASDVAPVAFWTSSDTEEEQIASQACRYCPVLTQCRQYGLRHPKEEGVYGGLTRQSRKELGSPRPVNEEGE